MAPGGGFPVVAGVRHDRGKDDALDLAPDRFKDAVLVGIQERLKGSVEVKGHGPGMGWAAGTSNLNGLWHSGLGQVIV